MNIADLGPAQDAAGKHVRDVFVVDTRTGTACHLAWGGADITETLCDLAFTTMSRTWFELAGCGRCRKAARALGVAKVTDVDGELIDV